MEKLKHHKIKPVIGFKKGAVWSERYCKRLIISGLQWYIMEDVSEEQIIAHENENGVGSLELFCIAF